MNDTIHMQKKPHWVQEALFLLLDWLLWKQVHPEGPVERWVEQPLFEDRAESVSPYTELEDYLKKVRKGVLPHFQSMDERWDRYAAVKRAQPETEEGGWLHGLFALLNAETPEAITAEALQLAAVDAVRVYAGKEPAPEE